MPVSIQPAVVFPGLFSWLLSMTIKINLTIIIHNLSVFPLVLILQMVGAWESCFIYQYYGQAVRKPIWIKTTRSGDRRAEKRNQQSRFQANSELGTQKNRDYSKGTRQHPEAIEEDGKVEERERGIPKVHRSLGEEAGGTEEERFGL